MKQIKIIFSGSVGAGKTSAINCISDIPMVSTEAKPSDHVRTMKASTTVSMDYGAVNLGPNQKIHLYGTPGQDRFDFMWEILAEGALGIILMIDISAKDPVSDLKKYITAFRHLIEKTALAIGLTFCDKNPFFDTTQIHKILLDENIIAPVFEVDGREASDIQLLLQSLLLSLDPTLNQ